MRLIFRTFLVLYLSASSGIFAKTKRAKDEGELMIKLFGNYDAQHQWSIWKPDHIPSEDSTFFEMGRGRTSVELDRIAYVGGLQKRFVVLSTVADSGRFEDCHACAVLLSAVVFSRQTKSPAIRENFLLIEGQKGQAPAILLRRMGREHTALD